jgi:DNA transformation protein
MDAAAIEDLFAAVGPVHTRRMFSGYGVFRDDLCFALVLRGEIYMKADAQTEALFRDAGSEPFSYERRGRLVSVAFWRLPDAALDDADAAGDWARIALEAAGRKKRRPPRKAKAKPALPPKLGARTKATRSRAERSCRSNRLIYRAFAGTGRRTHRAR